MFPDVCLVALLLLISSCFHLLTDRWTSLPSISLRPLGVDEWYSGKSKAHRFQISFYISKFRIFLACALQIEKDSKLAAVVHAIRVRKGLKVSHTFPIFVL